MNPFIAAKDSSGSGSPQGRDDNGKALESEVLARAVQLFVTDQLVVKDKKVIFRPGHIGVS